MSGIGAVFVFLLFAVCGVIGAFIGGPKGRPGMGLALGFLFGVLGLFIIAVAAPSAEAQKHSSEASHARSSTR